LIDLGAFRQFLIGEIGRGWFGLLGNEEGFLIREKPWRLSFVEIVVLLLLHYITSYVTYP